MAEMIQEFVSAAVHGEHLLLKVIYTNIIHHFHQHGLTSTKLPPNLPQDPIDKNK